MDTTAHYHLGGSNAPGSDCRRDLWQQDKHKISIAGSARALQCPLCKFFLQQSVLKAKVYLETRGNL
jgi:hypothetical protein